MRVVGIDPGLSRCGVGVIEGSVHRPLLLRVGVVRTAAGDPPGERLAQLRAALAAVVREAQADAVAIERVFFNANTSTAVGSVQAAGIALLVAAEAGLPACEYTPSQVKAAVTGSGDAGKEQVGFMVRASLRLSEAPKPADAADALAVALCHLQLGHTAGAVGGAGHPPRLAAAVALATAGAGVVARSGR